MPGLYSTACIVWKLVTLDESRVASVAHLSPRASISTEVARERKYAVNIAVSPIQEFRFSKQKKNERETKRNDSRAYRKFCMCVHTHMYVYIREYICVGQLCIMEIHRTLRLSEVIAYISLSRFKALRETFISVA